MQAQPHLIGMYGGYELTPNLMICVASIAVFFFFVSPPHARLCTQPCCCGIPCRTTVRLTPGINDNYWTSILLFG